MKIENIKPQIRHLNEIKDVLYSQKWANQAPNLELYYMYRDLSENESDKEKIVEKGLRYDITVLNPVMLGKEYNKTAGHDHPLVSNTDITYPEIYEVLEGKVIFLLQDSENDKIKDVYAIKAKEKDKVIIPPNYEHLIINHSKERAKTANWICRNFSSNIYKPFRSKHGFSYYALKEDKKISWIKNKNYSSIPELKFLEANQLLDEFKIKKEESLYNLVNDLDKLDFLKAPEKYQW